MAGASISSGWFGVPVWVGTVALSIGGGWLVNEWAKSRDDQLKATTAVVELKGELTRKHEEIAGDLRTIKSEQASNRELLTIQVQGIHREIDGVRRDVDRHENLLMRQKPAAAAQ